LSSLKKDGKKDETDSSSVRSSIKITKFNSANPNSKNQNCIEPHERDDEEEDYEDEDIPMSEDDVEKKPNKKTQWCVCDKGDISTLAFTCGECSHWYHKSCFLTGQENDDEDLICFYCKKDSEKIQKYIEGLRLRGLIDPDVYDNQDDSCSNDTDKFSDIMKPSKPKILLSDDENDAVSNEDDENRAHKLRVIFILFKK
jgi:hypothetical protein